MEQTDLVVSCYSYGKIVPSCLERAIGIKKMREYYMAYLKYFDYYKDY